MSQPPRQVRRQAPPSATAERASALRRSRSLLKVVLVLVFDRTKRA
jgi:hypothetical protein